MSVISSEDPQTSASAHDPLLPWLLSIRNALDNLDPEANYSTDFNNLLSKCIAAFKQDFKYRNDQRFLKIWFLYMDGAENYESVYREMEENKICTGYSILYESYALFLEARGKLLDALLVYQTGILRNAEPLERLKKMQRLFLDRVSNIVKACSLQKVDDRETVKPGNNYVNPWLITTIADLLEKMNPQMLKYEGYHRSTKPYKGKVTLASLKKSTRNRIFELGSTKYQIKGCAGKGGFAQVFRAHVNSDPDEVVALKIQEPPFAWEFYIYRQLDKRIPVKERPCFGSARSVYLYSDCSILVCDYLAHGTLQDAINSYVVVGEVMEELLCMYYTIEMLYMVETLHSFGIIHGDFKADNLMVRYARDALTEDGFFDRQGPWQDQGLCLVDWGRGIDFSLFPPDTEFNGDCRTSGLRCTEMQENKPWKFQVDMYGLCAVVHMMLHGTFMKVDKKTSSGGGYIYQPKTPLKRYWNVNLWETFFTKLLNGSPGEDHNALLRGLRESFQKYFGSKADLIKKLKQILVKQRTSLCSS